MEQIPTDVKRLIYEYADEEELAKLCMLNKDFSNKVCNSNFWVNKIMKRFNLTSDEIREFKGNNTVWAYYNYLTELILVLRLDRYGNPEVKIANVERIYHHPEFQRQYFNIFQYRLVPRWVNKRIFEKEFLYKLIVQMIDDIDFIDSGMTGYITGDIGTYEFLSNRDIENPDPELVSYIKSLK